MAASTYVRLAPDSTGKQVVMELVTLPDGTQAYRQVAQLEGPAGDAMQASLIIQMQTLSVLRSILARLDGNPLDETYMGL